MFNFTDFLIWRHGLFIPYGWLTTWFEVIWVELTDMDAVPLILLWLARPSRLGSWWRFGTSILNSGRHGKESGSP